MTRLARLLILLSLSVAACAPAARKTKPPTAPRPEAAATPKPTSEAPQATAKTIAVILTLHPESDPEKVLRLLEDDPDLKLTLLFPAGYFDGQDRAKASQRFSRLLSSGQIEIGLTLDNEPNLALLADLREAGDPVLKWGFNFAWPEDAAAQTARGSGRFRKRWGQLPSGFYPTAGAVSDEVMEVLRRFRLSWVLARPSEPWGVRFFGGVALLAPQQIPLSDETATAAAKETARLALQLPYSHIDAGQLSAPGFESAFLAELSNLYADAPAPLSTVKKFVEGLRSEFALPDGADPFANDHSAWVQSPLQKRAWQALADARQVIENYKNSGRANLNRLDAAIEEMCVAESGPFLLALGDPNASTTFGQRNFLATLANVYRLAGVPVPANLNTWFADRSWHKAPARTTDNDRPFFVEGPQSLTWNDPKNDDNGTGTYTYPTGAFPKGAFDLREVTVAWTDAEVTFSAGVADLPRAGTVAVAPLTDIYIDVNRLSEAGSTAMLARRGQAVVERDAAWEYAVSITPNIAALYQGLPGGEQRLLMTKPAEVSGNTFSVSFPRRLVRGDPRQWRLTAAAGAAEVSRRDEAPAPIAVLPVAAQKAFGGAPGPRTPPRYIDLLAPTSDIQANRLQAYQAGTVILPFVEAE